MSGLCYYLGSSVGSNQPQIYPSSRILNCMLGNWSPENLRYDSFPVRVGGNEVLTNNLAGPHTGTGSMDRKNCLMFGKRLQLVEWAFLRIKPSLTSFILGWEDVIIGNSHKIKRVLVELMCNLLMSSVLFQEWFSCLHGVGVAGLKCLN